MFEKTNVQNAWILRPKPHGTDQMRYFLKNNRICIGYPLGYSLNDFNFTELKRALIEEDDKRKNNGELNSNWIGGLSNLNILVREMGIGDLVVVPHGNEIYFCVVKSEYTYLPEFDEDKKGSGFPHQREVEWLLEGKSISRNELPEALRHSLQFPGTAASISKHINVLLDLLSDTRIGDVPEKNKLNILKDDSLKFVTNVLHNEKYPTEQRLRAAEIILNMK
ncbi:hypothetical protein [Jeotgalibacillus aurantiacus]|uniref:hypothetical protein n=1 Tax=Jeotgalibacillus aurantiacus TaxID=2763266 RepID=UPI001D0A9593|nr:hypothetical protein [Jeotgalibacillus aurantiacus]